MLKARGRLALALVTTVAAISAAGCSTGGSPRPPGSDPDDDAAAIRARYRATPAADASLAVRIKPAKGDALNIQLHIWCAADGRVRINASKLDVDFCSALLKPDGTYTIVAPRAHLGAMGTFDDHDRATLSSLLTKPAFISDELRDGPMPQLSNWKMTRFGGDAINMTLIGQTVDGIQIFVSWDDGTGLLTDKTLVYNDHGTQTKMLGISYSHDHDFDGFLRPTLAQVVVPGDDGTDTNATRITVGLRSFDALGSISAERMHLDVPADARTVPLTELLKHLGD